MPIPNPTLDDKPYERLVEESKKKIAVYAKTWTDHNVSDPGITLIELFAWLAENEIYSLNKISQKNYMKFLRLLGYNPSMAFATPPKLQLTFNATNLDDPVMIQKGASVKSSDLIDDVFFDTDEDFTVVPLRISKILISTRRGYEDQTLLNNNIENYFYPFTETPTSQVSAFYIGLEKLTKKSIDSLSDALLTVTFFTYEDDLPEVGNHGSEDLKIYLSSSAIWEYLSSNNGLDVPPTNMRWNSLELNEDSTKVLTGNGRILFQIPFSEVDKYSTSDLIGTAFVSGNISDKKNEELFWIRCRLIKNHYEIPPRLRTVLINTMSATFGQVVEKGVGAGNGMPGQDIEINEPKAPVIEIIQVKSFESMNNTEKIWKEWKEVEDFDASTPDDKHYVCSSSKDHILFGNGIHGCIPKIDEKIVVKYRFGDIEQNYLFNSRIKFILDSRDVVRPPLKFDWTQTGGPEVILNNPTSANPTFTSPQVEEETRLTFQLVVSSDTATSDPDSVTVSVTPHTTIPKPIADAGTDITVQSNMLTQLDGSKSYDPNNSVDVVRPPLKFDWTQTGGPEVILNNPTSANPTFTSPQVEEETRLTFQLVVSSDTATSDPDSVTVSVTPHTTIPKPIADAGTDITVQSNMLTQLDGSKSYDPNNSGDDIEAINYFQSTKGIARELVTDMISRARKDLIIPHKAVSSSDFEYITINTPGLRISRAKAFVSKDKEVKNTVTVIVVPFSFDDTPIPNDGLLRTVYHHLDMHRLITTRLEVRAPEYVGITVISKVAIEKNSNPQTVKEVVYTVLSNFLSPLSRKPGQNAWPFGRDVYKSEIYAILEQIHGVECIVELTLLGSGNSINFENRDGNVLVRNYSLVYLKSSSISVVSRNTESCTRMKGDK